MNTTSQSTTPLGRFVQDNIFYIGAVAEFVTMDYLTKFFAELYLANGKTIAVISNYFSLTVSHNSKIAFSLPISGKLVAFITPLLLAVIIYLVKKTCDTSNKITKIALVFVISTYLILILLQKCKFCGPGKAIDFCSKLPTLSVSLLMIL